MFNPLVFRMSTEGLLNCKDRGWKGAGITLAGIAYLKLRARYMAS